MIWTWFREKDLNLRRPYRKPLGFLFRHLPSLWKVGSVLLAVLSLRVGPEFMAERHLTLKESPLKSVFEARETFIRVTLIVPYLVLGPVVAGDEVPLRFGSFLLNINCS